MESVVFSIEDETANEEKYACESAIAVQEYPELCRTCLSKEDIRPIFQLNYRGVEFHQIFEKCSAVKIGRDDDLPQNICHKCINDIVYVYKFMLKCQESDIILRAAVNKVDNEIFENVKVEADDDKESISPIQLWEKIDSQLDEKSDNNNFNTEDVEPKCAVNKKKKSSNFCTKKKDVAVACNNCNYTVCSYKKLSIHCRQTGHCMPKRYKCEYCEKFFISPSRLSLHVKSVHTKEKPYECEICGFKFSAKFTLRRHMMKHTGVKPYTCEICGKGFRETSYLENHLRKHSGEKPFVCSYCGEGFSNPRNHKQHERKHEVEDILNKKGRTNLADEALKNPDLFDNVCTKCTKVFASKYTLGQHLLTHQDKRAYLCSECGKCFVTKGALQVHSTVHTGAKPYTCEICHKSFSQLGTLNVHRLVHTEEKSYECKICKRGFKLNSQLSRHMITHSGEKPFSCTYCDKSFALKCNLIAHIRIHTGETPYGCDVCGKRFYHSNNMKKHRKIHNSVKNKAVK